MNIFKKSLQSPIIRQYLFNSSWMLAEQCLRVLAGIFVGIYIARYLGPEQFGTLSYVLAISAFILAITRMGMDSILVRELVNTEVNREELVGTAFWVMMTSALVCYLVAATAIWSFDEVSDIKMYACIVSGSAFFTSFLAIDYFFQSQLKAKYSAICKTVTLFLMSLVKLSLIFSGAELLWFVVISLLDHVLLAVLLLIALSKTQNLRFLQCFNKSTAKLMLKSAWPMVISAVAVLVYMRIDQVMIRSMLGLRDVGLYSAAIRVYEAWIVFPYVIAISLLPAIAKLKKGHEELYHEKLTQIFSFIMWVSIFAAIIVSIFSEPIMVVAFGNEYRGSTSVVNILMWTAVFTSIGSVSARYFNVEHMEKKIALRTMVAALINVVLNWLLIPKFGIKGAAYSTLFCTFFANYLMDWFDKDLKILLKIKHRALFSHLFRSTGYG
ncbi:polysaccharide biosynthesis protein [Stutzerimonas stutzeri ATCC 14405 = CCUG 16156]|uniref:flippase n=1 Tax=Stutzerimonas stutzeri TaxID=316 RepID=UPI0002548E38|nr:flippase [Stutzerimonas stutzeri]EHY76311.1 polysaccharide biosynthesis protein [Stutzerimonas stutzeri ATCC 14405 = CCUG 16156]QOZ96258.1 flippase [Stutzerimonas stutzeri]